ncbi:hypothetical protein Hanom_Chr00s002156g01692741 [Helianthus anomalus]
MSFTVRSSHRLKRKMYKSRFKNTIDSPDVLSDSETSNNDGDAGMNDASNAETRQDVLESTKNTQGTVGENSVVIIIC